MHLGPIGPGRIGVLLTERNIWACLRLYQGRGSVDYLGMRGGWRRDFGVCFGGKGCGKGFWGWGLV